MAIRVLHVAHGVEQEQTGAGYVIPKLCCALAGKGIQVTLVALDLGGEVVEGWAEEGGLELRRFPYKGPRKIGFSPELRFFLNDALNDADVIHTHFLWAYPQALAARLALRREKPLIQAPHGTLFPEALSQSKVAKYLWYKLIDGPTLQRAQCVVATSENEAKCIQDRVHPKRLEIIPHAIEPPDLPDSNFAARRAEEILGHEGRKYVLYLGNLHPHKNLEKLIAVWADLQKHWPNHILTIVGPGPERYRKRLERLIRRFGQATRIRTFGPIYGLDKWALLGAADTVVLPSRSENFGLVVAEALSCGTPVVASRGTPWPWLETEGFGHWVETQDPFLADALEDVLSWSPHKRQYMASSARRFIRARFSWEEVASQYISLYRDLLQ